MIYEHLGGRKIGRISFDKMYFKYICKKTCCKSRSLVYFLFMVELFGLIFRFTGKVKSELSENRRINL